MAQINLNKTDLGAKQYSIPVSLAQFIILLFKPSSAEHPDRSSLLPKTEDKGGPDTGVPGVMEHAVRAVTEGTSTEPPALLPTSPSMMLGRPSSE